MCIRFSANNYIVLAGVNYTRLSDSVSVNYTRPSHLVSVNYTRLSHSVSVNFSSADTQALALFRPKRQARRKIAASCRKHTLRLGVNSCDVAFECMSDQVHAAVSFYISIKLRCVMRGVNICVAVTKGLNRMQTFHWIQFVS